MPTTPASWSPLLLGPSWAVICSCKAFVEGAQFRPTALSCFLEPHARHLACRLGLFSDMRYYSEGLRFTFPVIVWSTGLTVAPRVTRTRLARAAVANDQPLGSKVGQDAPSQFWPPKYAILPTIPCCTFTTSWDLAVGYTRGCKRAFFLQDLTIVCSICCKA